MLCDMMKKMCNGAMTNYMSTAPSACVEDQTVSTGIKQEGS